MVLLGSFVRLWEIHWGGGFKSSLDKNHCFFLEIKNHWRGVLGGGGGIHETNHCMGRLKSARSCLSAFVKHSI